MNTTDYKYAFEKLDVWSDARQFVKYIYSITKTFPDIERYGLCSQMQRAAVSIASNIAEGSSRLSDKEKIRFFEISYGSLMEVYCQLHLALDLEYIDNKTVEAAKPLIDAIARRLSALKKVLTQRSNNA
jgi:four helix bundle protein